MTALVRHPGFELYALVQTTHELLGAEKIRCFLPCIKLKTVSIGSQKEQELITNYNKMLKKKKEMEESSFVIVEEASPKNVGPLLNNHLFCIDGEPTSLLAIIYQHEWIGKIIF